MKDRRKEGSKPSWEGRKKKRVGKYIGWKPQYKKAIVTLSEGDVINLFTDN